MKKTVAAFIATCGLLGACVPPTSSSNGIPRDNVATEVTQLVRGIHWNKIEGVKSCSGTPENKTLQPTWAQFTVSMIEQEGKEVNSSGTLIPVMLVLPVTPTLGLDLKEQRAVQTDTVLAIKGLDKSAGWPPSQDKNRQEEAKQLTKLIEDAENDLVRGGDSEQPCIAVNALTVTTVLDMVQTGNAGIKFGFGPVTVANFGGSLSREAKAALKIEVHYSGSPPLGPVMLTY